MAVNPSAKFLFTHREFRDACTKRLADTHARWEKQQDDYLSNLLLTDTAASGSSHSWADGWRALVVAVTGPHAVGEALYCGAFWRDGNYAVVDYLLLKRGVDGCYLTRQHSGQHIYRGRASSSSPAEFAALGKWLLDQGASQLNLDLASNK